MNELFQEQADNKPVFDDSKDYFAELVGENAKFKTPQDLAKSKVRSDLYIQDVLRQKDEQAAYIIELQKQLDARATIEEAMDQLATRIDSREQPQKADISPKTSINYDEIDQRFDKMLTAREQKRIEDANLATTRKMLKEHLGDNFAQVVRERIDGLELSETDVNNLAKRSPKTLAKVLGLEQQDNTLFQAPPSNQRRSDNFKPQTQKRTWTHYQELKKTNPRLYLDPKIAVQMHNDHIALGSAFEDGDFHQNN